MNSVLVSYARDPETRKPFGTVVAMKDEDGHVYIGWSKLSPKEKRPRKEMGVQVALGRASQGTKAVIPVELDDCIDRMRARVKNYFKVWDDEITVVGTYPLLV